jgi:zeaxanthin epoxidase
MAIEDGYQLAVDLSEAVQRAETSGRALDIEGILKVETLCSVKAKVIPIHPGLLMTPAGCAMQGYQGKRLARASTIHGLAGMAAIMASTYKAYLGEGLGPLSFIKQLRIPHPGRVRLSLSLSACMPSKATQCLCQDQAETRCTEVNCGSCARWAATLP